MVLGCLRSYWFELCSQVDGSSWHGRIRWSSSHAYAGTAVVRLRSWSCGCGVPYDSAAKKQVAGCFACVADFRETRRPPKAGQDGLVEALVAHREVGSKAAQALRQVDRAMFVPEDTPEDCMYLVSDKSNNGTVTVSLRSFTNTLLPTG